MFKMLVFMIVAGVFVGTLDAVIYDAYTGQPASEEMIRLYEHRNNSKYCTVDVKPCDLNEWRRVDGTCNNLKYPNRGAPPSPNLKLLPTDFSIDYEPRNSKSGQELPLPRHLRCELLREGKAHELDITQLVSYYILFASDDVNSVHDISNYIRNTTNCCTREGKSNYACTPVTIPELDPIHRFSGVRCQNLTRPQSLQYFGCLEFGTPFVRASQNSFKNLKVNNFNNSSSMFSHDNIPQINFATSLFDLSGVYGHLPETIYSIRVFENGLLKYDEKTFKETGKVFPIGDHSAKFNNFECIHNQFPKESLCYLYNPNPILGPNLFLIMFYRQHNYIARELRKLNPCWNDNMLFYTARDINIAIQMQIYMYELQPIVLGKENLVKNKIISLSSGFRDLYNDKVLPEIIDEFSYAHRWFHTIQEATLKLYDKDGYFIKTFPLVNATERSGFFPLDNNIDKIIAGSFRQVSGRFDDHTIDFDMAERGLGALLFASDIATNDLFKGRLFGFASYVKYREFCSGRPHKHFYDLKDVISEERLYRLREVYENVEDIDLMAGLWSENLIKGGKVPVTVYCLLAEQLKRTLASDRHWYERPNRPHAFTNKQLASIRKVTVAGVLCTHGDGVTKIQPRAFYSINKKQNPLTDCTSDQIGKLDVSPWRDLGCMLKSST